jgi:hypothetical protein
LKVNFARHRILGGEFFSLNTSIFHSLLACMGSEKKSDVILCFSIDRVFFLCILLGFFLYLWFLVLWKWYV